MVLRQTFILKKGFSSSLDLKTSELMLGPDEAFQLEDKARSLP
jgi:hypothetical protein